MTRPMLRTPDQPPATPDRSPYQRGKATLGEAVTGAKDGWTEGAPGAPAQPPTPPTPPAAPATPAEAAAAVTGAQVAADGAIIFDGADGQQISIGWDQGALRVTQGTRTMAIPTQELIPSAAVDITIALCATLVAVVLGAPLLRFWLRRAERRQALPQGDAALAARLAQLEQHVDTVAVELERVSEGQRYFTRLLEAREGQPLRDPAAREGAATPPRQG